MKVACLRVNTMEPGSPAMFHTYEQNSVTHAIAAEAARPVETNFFSMKKLILLLMASALFRIAFSQQEPRKAPLNPEFVKYLEMITQEQGKKSLENKTGYTPSPLYIHFNESAYLSGPKKSSASLPSGYDLRDYDWVTPVKDQAPLGSCWTFSSVSAIETRWLKLGYGTPGTLNLSEQNMGTCHGFEWGIDDGGNDMISTAYLTRLAGPVTEDSDPYTGDPDASCNFLNTVIPAFSPTVEYLPPDVDVVKRAVFEYGGVISSMNTGGFNMSAYFNKNDYTFYYPGTNPVDHSVQIVGWNDNIAVTGGYGSPKGTMGAWIVKNSWGTGWARNGYFYVGYADSKFLSSVSVFPERAEKSEIDTLYFFDKLGATTSYGYSDHTGYGLVKYSAPGRHFISKVGTFINTSGTLIDIEIYDDFQGDSLLTNLISSSYGNIVKFPGYSTFDIPAIVEGDYYIKIRYFTPGYTYPIPAEAPISFQGEDYAVPKLLNSGTFWISRDGDRWSPMGKDIENREADLCIRAYADRSSELNAFFTANRDIACVGTSVTFTGESNGNINTYQWEFGEGATPSSANTAGPHEVVYNTPGLKNVSLSITGPAGTRTLLKNSYISVVEQDLDVLIPISEYRLASGKSIAITAFGAEDYTWSPAGGLNTTTGNTVIASPLDTTTYTVNGSIGSCTGSASVTINVVENPDNDDVCEAIELSPGGWIGVFDNIYATVEPGEPYAPEGECDEPMHWCVEGGLQNSVWFTFTGPDNGVVNIITKGMDNQLALYKAESCDSLFSPTGFEMVAAFDDYYGSDQEYAAALESVPVEPGVRYFLQSDGSAGGVEGSFELIFWDYPMSDSDMKNELNKAGMLKIFPNPGDGLFDLSLKGSYGEEVFIKIFDNSGKLVFADERRNYPDQLISLDLRNLRPGVYFLKIHAEQDDYVRNLIIQ